LTEQEAELCEKLEASKDRTKFENQHLATQKSRASTNYEKMQPKSLARSKYFIGEG